MARLDPGPAKRALHARCAQISVAIFAVGCAEVLSADFDDTRVDPGDSGVGDASLAPDYFIRAYGGAKFDHAQSLAVDASGNIVFSGCFNDTIHFGGLPLTTSEVGCEGYVTKLDPMGQHVASTALGMTDFVTSLDLRSNGSPIVAGHLTLAAPKTIQIAKGVSFAADAGKSGFVVGLDSAVSPTWAQPLRAPDLGEPIVRATSGGAALVTTHFLGSLQWGSLQAAGGASDWDIALVRFSETGAFEWAARFGDGAEQRVASLTRSGESFVLAGTFRTNSPTGFDFNVRGGDCASVTNASNAPALVVVRMDADGKCIQSRAFGAGVAALEPQVVTSVLADNSIVIAGSFSGTLGFGVGLDSILTATGESPNPFVVRLGSNLEWVSGTSFARQIEFAPGASGEMWPWSLAANPQGVLLVSWFVRANATPIVMDQLLPTSGSSDDDGIITAFSPSGTMLSGKRYAVGDVFWPKQLVWDPTQPSWLLAGAWGTEYAIAPPLDLGNSANVNNHGYIDAFVARLPP